MSAHEYKIAEEREWFAIAGKLAIPNRYRSAHLVTSRQKRYSFADPLLRTWVRLHCRPTAPTDEDLAREIHRYALPRLPARPEPALALAGAVGDEERKEWGIIEID